MSTPTDTSSTGDTSTNESDTPSNTGGAADPSDADLDRNTAVTRRRLLVGVAALGTLGSFTGGGTYTALSDESFLRHNQLSSGSMDLSLAWTARRESAAGDSQELDAVGVYGSDDVADHHDTARPAVIVRGTDALKPGDSVELKLSVWSETAASVWGRLTSLGGDAEAYVDVDAARDTECVGSWEALSAGTSWESLADGVELTDELDASSSPLCLRITWTLPQSLPSEARNERVEFGVEFTAEQSRRVDSTNPWANRNGDFTTGDSNS